MEQKKLIVLVAEDDPAIVRAVADMLTCTFHSALDIRNAKNGEGAYDSIKAQKPDILITDVKMPKMHGDELIEQLVKEERKIPAFVMSGNFYEGAQRGVKAVYHSLSMYTPEQATELVLPIGIKSPEEFLKNMNELYRAAMSEPTEINTGRPEFNLGFTAIQKPFDFDVFIGKLQKVYQMLSR